MNTKAITMGIRRAISGIVASAITLSSIPAMAAENEKYPYTLFAASSEDGAITTTAYNFCVNGNVCTNGTIVANGNLNVNGTKTENAGQDMIYIFDKIDDEYFTSDSFDEYTEDYVLEEININISVPTDVMGETELVGNININTALKSYEDIMLSGEVKNTIDSVICSQYGDIIIDSTNVNLNGLVYAPRGVVDITAQNLNLNNVVIIADRIILDCPSVNANYSEAAAALVGTVSTDDTDSYDELLDENGNGIPDFYEDPENWESLPDTDNDGIKDFIEEYIGTDLENVDTDDDNLSDFYELDIAYTDPTKADTDGNDICDSDEDSDEDGMTTFEELAAGTSPISSDTDCDSIWDGRELEIGTDPLNHDTDGDGINDGDELAVCLDPTNSATNGIPDNEYTIRQLVDKTSSACYTVNTDDNAYSLSLELTAAGYVENALIVEKSHYANAIKNDAQLGMAVDVAYSEGLAIEECVLKFEIKDEYVANALDVYTLYTDELVGIKRLQIFRFDEESNILTPVYTEFDADSNTVFCDASEMGTYCLLDVEVFLDSLGFVPSEPAVALMSLSAVDYSAYKAEMVMYDYGSNKYGIYTGTDNITWHEAKEICENLGGHLATITTVAEQAAFDEMLVGTESGSYWLGGTEEKELDNWYWITGEAFVYANWGNKQPNSAYDNTENYLGVLTKSYNWGTFGEWNDFRADDRYVKGFVCEWEVVTPTAYRLLYGHNLKDVVLNAPLTPSTLADYDEDSLTDWAEVDEDSSLISYDSNGMPVFKRWSDCFNAPAFFPRESPLYGQIPNLEELMYSIQIVPCDSDPTLPDTDGDDCLDVVDPNRLKYQLNQEFIYNVGLVCELANEYCSNLSIDSSKYNNRLAEAFVFMFIRYFEINYNGDHKYCIGSWPGVAGKLDEGFIEYVHNTNKSVYEYFSITNVVASAPMQYDIDLNHMAATISALLYESDFSDGHNVAASLKHGIMSEKHINALAGWAGDMQSLIHDCYYDSIETEGKTIVDYFELGLGNDDSRCGQVDLNSDADAVNIISLLLETEKSLTEVLVEYYSYGVQNRYTSFVNNALYDSINTITPYSKDKYLVVAWPILGSDVKISNDEAEEIKQIFWDYIQRLKAKELA